MRPPEDGEALAPWLLLFAALVVGRIAEDAGSTAAGSKAPPTRPLGAELGPRALEVSPQRLEPVVPLLARAREAVAGLPALPLALHESASDRAARCLATACRVIGSSPVSWVAVAVPLVEG